MFSPATVIYFIAPYMVGIYIGQNLEQVHRWITERQVLLFSIFIIFSIAYFFMMMNDIKEVKWGFLTINSQETITYILRMCAALLMLELLRQYVSKVPTWLDYLAKYAFAIYFIHVMFIMLLIKLLEVIDYKPVSAGETFTLGLVTYVVSILGSVLVSMLIKRLTGRYSRQLIGA
jgi:peptidoglycan/LPS O-acetylase OafA/YrhL